MTYSRAQVALALFLMFASAGASAESRSRALLVDAARAGDASAVAALLKSGADVNAAAVDGTTALHWAAHRDDLRLIDQLLRAGANVNAKNRYGAAPISVAAVNPSAVVMKRLLDAGADPNAIMNGETVLMTAAASGGGEVIRLLAGLGANVNATSGPDSGLTALMIAAASNNVGAVKELIELGVSVNARTTNPAVDNGIKGFVADNWADVLEEFRPKKPTPEPIPQRQFTAFLFAARAGHTDVMQALLDAGANVNETLSDGTSALMLAVTSNKLDAASFLLDRGADPNSAGSGWTALHQLSVARRPNAGHNQLGPVSRDRIDSLDLAKKLVAKGADVNARMTKAMNQMYSGRITLQHEGNTPFALAALRLDLDYMRVLVELGANPLLANDQGTTPLMIAAGCGVYSPGENPGSIEELDEAISWLLSLGADPNTVDAFGETPLHCAAFRGGTRGIEALVAAGAKLDAKNMRTKKRRSGTTPSVGWTPLMIADGIYIGGGAKEQLKSAAVLRRLMQERGMSTDYTLPGQ